MAALLERDCARKTEKFAVLEAPAAIVNNFRLSYVGSHASRGADDTQCSPVPPADAAKYIEPDPTIAQFLAHLTRRQLQIAAAYYVGKTQSEIAADHDVTQGTVSNELRAVKDTCKRFGKEMPKPLRVCSGRKVPLTDALSDSLGI